MKGARQEELFQIASLPTRAEPPVGPRPEPGSDLVRAFGRFWRLFRRQLQESYGRRYEKIVAGAEIKVKALSPDVDFDALTDETATAALDIVELIVGEASIMKRSRLRLSAITLISDLYNKHYTVLERHGAIGRVEQAYNRIRR